MRVALMHAQQIAGCHQLAHAALTHASSAPLFARRATHAHDLRAGLVGERQILHGDPPRERDQQRARSRLAHERSKCRAPETAEQAGAILPHRVYQHSIAPSAAAAASTVDGAAPPTSSQSAYATATTAQGDDGSSAPSITRASLARTASISRTSANPTFTNIAPASAAARAAVASNLAS